MQHGGIVLCNTSLVAVGSNVIGGTSQAADTWRGGRGVLVIAATQFAPVVNLMLVEVGNALLSIKMNSTAIQANTVLSLDLPAGKYQIHSATGSSVGMYAGLFAAR